MFDRRKVFNVSSKQFVVFTDLDGTLLDRETYSPNEALPAMDVLREKRIPIVFCSSKTRKEQEWYRKRLCIDDPFIVEDGGAIISRDDYFPFSYGYQRRVSDYTVIDLGAKYSEIRRALREVESELNLEIVGYGDLSSSAVAELTGLSKEEAARAKVREYQETLVSKYRKDDLNRLKRALEKRDLVLSPGAQFIGVGGLTDKGIAVDILTTFYQWKYDEVLTIGIGDSPNDFPMFLSVDIPVQVKKPDGTWEQIEMDLHRIDGIGPKGWNKFVMERFA
jgi:mannosyl-3-phosphoglycerate phosphatase